MRTITRRDAMSGAMALGLLPLSGTRRAWAKASSVDQVNVGIIGVSTDVLFVIGEQRGYFKNNGIAVNFVKFGSGAKMIPSLGQGQIDVLGAITSAGLYNAVARGIGISIVADKGHMEPGYKNQTMFIRKDLIKDGKFKSLSDLRGKKIALTAPGVATMSVLNQAAKAGGISYGDINTAFMPFPAQIAAFKNGAVDGSIMAEPFATILSNLGVGERFCTTNKFDPHFQIAILAFGENFGKKRDVAIRFLKGYLHAVRDYNKTLADGGRLRGPGSEAIIKMMTSHFRVSSHLAKNMYSAAFSDNGEVYVPSLEKAWRFFKDHKLISGKVTVEQIVDPSFAKQAAAELGSKG